MNRWITIRYHTHQHTPSKTECGCPNDRGIRNGPIQKSSPNRLVDYLHKKLNAHIKNKQSTSKGGEKTDKKAYYSWANLVALVADVVSVSLHGKGCWILKESTPGSCDGITLVQPLVLQAHQSLASHVVIQLSERVQERAQHLVFYFTLHRVEQRNFATPRVLFHTAHSTTGRL